MHFGLLVRDGYVMGVMKKSDFLYLSDSRARNSLGIPDKNGTNVVLKFSELCECQTHLETLGHCLNVGYLTFLLSIFMLMLMKPSSLNKVI